MSHQSDSLHKPCGQMKDQGLKTQKPHPPVMELILRLRQLIDEYSRQLKIRHLQEDLEQEKQRHSQDTREQEAILVQLLGEVVNLLQAGATSSLELQLPRLSLDSRGGGGQQARLPRKPDQLSHQLSDSKAAVVSCDLSTRGIDISASYKSSFKDFIAYQGDKYHEDKNTSGFINLGLSENKLCIDLLTERLSQSDMNYIDGDLLQYPDWSGHALVHLGWAEGLISDSFHLQGFINLGLSENKLCIDLLTERLSRSDMNYIDDDLLQYPDWSGHAFLREEVARFLTYYCKAPEQLDPENVVVLSGCCAIFSALTLVLCNPGDAFLIITPFYSGFTFTSSLYVNVELIRVHLDSEITEADTQPFQLTVDKLEKALLEAKFKGKKVRGLVLFNPNNSLGDIGSLDSLMEYLEFAKRYNLHVIIDEIYRGTVFDESIPFHSVLSMESLPDPNRTHVIWGTSKGFGISGFRFGTLYTHNKEVVSAVGAFGFLHGISGITQHKLCRLLQDREWIDNVYLPTNRSRMQEAHRYITNRLKTLKIPFLNRGSGLYIWVNLKEYLDPCTFEEEQLLYRRFLDNKLLLAPGKAYMCKEPGWFRLTFTDNPLRLKVAMNRFSQALLEQKQYWVEKQMKCVLGE
ncbi:1-aminocyclopropane-1-carboxylate synthase-like protein 2 [Myotis brandtii]|uniref:1-aminocyclopropane-1-carboxylate synthase-like protein 2 n=1 Tax=Myotis brandtii TaxID=109478 RepID=S7N0M2_MYOBR|nr:1-aminocyclopropane-1-carboxylate synthase-like protein 2 [Myotis brandtii]